MPRTNRPIRSWHMMDARMLPASQDETLLTQRTELFDYFANDGRV